MFMVPGAVGTSPGGLRFYPEHHGFYFTNGSQCGLIVTVMGLVKIDKHPCSYGVGSKP